MPDDPLPDPYDAADFDLPDQQALIDAFMAGLSKESQYDFRGLSALLATLPDPSLSHGLVEALSVTEAREKSLIPQASDETLQAFSSSEMKLYKDEVSNATMCPTTQCTTCWCPKARLSDPDVVYPFRDTQDIRERVAEERKKLLHRDGQPRDRCKEKVC
jgi:hypothetical protein